MTSDKTVVVDRHLCLTEDRCRVVEETDPRARWLHWPKGTEVPKDEYDRLMKQDAPSPNKMRRPQRNK